MVPNNIILVFLPPYSPELNPAEKMWQKIKRDFTNKLHRTLDELSDFISESVNSLSNEIVKSTCGYEYVFQSHFWTIL